MQHQLLWPVIGCAIILVGTIWAFGGYDELSTAGGIGLTWGIVATLMVGIGLMAVILYGRRSRRDRVVDRATRHDE
ncbi:MAG TPA: hypothetical protein VD978_14535 [Azospirillum sp.]|nr:hypothetical protein [Azospirillum sp.]